MRVKEFLDTCKRMQDGYFIAALTDEFIVDSLPEIYAHDLISKEEKVLEIRIFNNEMETKLFRTDIGREFCERTIKDSDDKRDRIIEDQFLDIDTKIVQSEGVVTATGGGKYNLPFSKITDAKIRICYYLERYEETGQARVADWRVVDFVEGK